MAVSRDGGVDEGRIEGREVRVRERVAGEGVGQEVLDQDIASLGEGAEDGLPLGRGKGEGEGFLVSVDLN